MEVIRHLTTDIGARLAGSLSEKAAAEYLASKFDELGLEVKIETQSCWTCDDKWIVCLDNIDGGTSVTHRSEKFKCDESSYPIIRDGESGKIYNINTGELQ